MMCVYFPMPIGKGFNVLYFGNGWECRNASHKFKLQLQSVDRQVDHWNVKCWPYISVVYEQKWLKFCFQAHFFKMFRHSKFQLSIIFTFRVKILIVDESIDRKWWGAEILHEQRSWKTVDVKKKFSQFGL